MMKRRLALTIAIVFFAATAAPAADAVRRFLLLVDYIGSDYSAAVENGRVINDAEYQEMEVFGDDALTLFDALPPPPDRAQAKVIQENLRELRRLIAEKAPPAQVASLSRTIKNAAVSLYKVATYPPGPPDLRAAKQLYAENCAACHGEDGAAQTELARRLDPRPTNFRDPETMGGMSPFKAYNVLSFGIAGTPMPSFEALSEGDRWALAFYISALRFSTEEADRGLSLLQDKPESTKADIKTLSSLTDGELVDRLDSWGLGSEEDKRLALAYLRLRVPSQTSSDPLARSLELLTRSRTLLSEGRSREAAQTLIDAYLDGFELAEPELNARSPGRVAHIERMFLDARQALKEARKTPEAMDLLSRLEEEILRARDELRQASGGPWFFFLNSLVIILREGIEAALIIAAILALLRGAGHRGASLYVHAGWAAAIAASLATWVVARFVIAMSGSQRELIEAVTALLAAAVLVYVSYWLISKLEAKKWQAFVQKSVERALSGGNLFALSGVSFLAVYREGFETVLFYQALLAQAGEIRNAVFLGLATGTVLLLGAILAIFKLALRVPLRAFFGATSVILYALAVIFVGHGIFRLQTIGLLPHTPVAVTPYPALGIYPSLEALWLQGAFMAIYAGSLLWSGWRGNRETARRP